MALRERAGARVHDARGGGGEHVCEGRRLGAHVRRRGLGEGVACVRFGEKLLAGRVHLLFAGAGVGGRVAVRERRALGRRGVAVLEKRKTAKEAIDQHDERQG